MLRRRRVAERLVGPLLVVATLELVQAFDLLPQAQQDPQHVVINQ